MYSDLYFKVKGICREQYFNKVFFVSRSAVAVQTYDLPPANLYLRAELFKAGLS